VSRQCSIYLLVVQPRRNHVPPHVPGAHHQRVARLTPATSPAPTSPTSSAPPRAPAAASRRFRYHQRSPLSCFLGGHERGMSKCLVLARPPGRQRRTETCSTTRARALSEKSEFAVLVPARTQHGQHGSPIFDHLVSSCVVPQVYSFSCRLNQIQSNYM
jgi:hypothetical protein